MFLINLFFNYDHSCRPPFISITKSSTNNNTKETKNCRDFLVTKVLDESFLQRKKTREKNNVKRKILL